MNLKEAGKVIGAGGFGCVFYPALKCKNRKSGKNLISKLSVKQEVAKEQAVNERIKPTILKIKNHNKYFLINRIFSCSPEPLNKKDLEKFDKCVTLLNSGFTEKNINNNLDKFDILNVPYGGEDLSEILYLSGKNFKLKFKYFNEKFIDLLEYAIYPMNKLGLIHCDMKGSNLLINLKKKDSGIKIIDWALSNLINNSREIPLEIRFRTFQFNLPFSSILFTRGFKEGYKVILNKYPNSLRREITDSFLINYIKLYFFENTHLIYILNYFFPLIFGKDKIYERFEESLLNNKGFVFIIRYLTKILLKYTNNNNEFNENKYFFEVFSKNIDKWGFLTIYLEILLITNNSSINNKSILNLVKKFLYSEEYATVEIPEKLLIKNLKNLKLLTFNKTKKKNY